MAIAEHLVGRATARCASRAPGFRAAGLWQTEGRSDLSWDDSVRLDLYYVENWSLTGDIILLYRTARAVAHPGGAY